MFVYDEMMRCDIKFCIIIVVIVMVINGGYKFNLSGFRWNFNDVSVIFFVVVFVKFVIFE